MKRRIQLKLVWYDFWIGIYLDTKNQTIYICLLPWFPIIIFYGQIWFKAHEKPDCDRRIELLYRDHSMLNPSKEYNPECKACATVKKIKDELWVIQDLGGEWPWSKVNRLTEWRYVD